MQHDSNTLNEPVPPGLPSVNTKRTSPYWFGTHPPGQGVIRVPRAPADGDRVLEAPATTEMDAWCQYVLLKSGAVTPNTTLELLVFQIS